MKTLWCICRDTANDDGQLTAPIKCEVSRATHDGAEILLTDEDGGTLWAPKDKTFESELAAWQAYYDAAEAEMSKWQHEFITARERK